MRYRPAPSLVPLVLVAGCTQPSLAFDLQGTPELSLSAWVERVEDGRVHVGLRVVNTGDADAFLTPPWNCGAGSAVAIEGARPAGAPEPSDCARIQLRDQHLVRVPAGGSFEGWTRSARHDLVPGTPLRAHVSWSSAPLPTDAFTLPLWRGTLQAAPIAFRA